MKKSHLFLLAAFLIVSLSKANAQQVALKTNLLYWSTTTPNLSLEMALSKKITLDIQGGYNPWLFSSEEYNQKFKHWLVQPELRLWTCEKFSGGFFGFHAMYGEFNAGGIKLPLKIFENFKDNRYEGSFVGGGFSYGHQWFLGNHWNLEATFGFGYLYVDYKNYERQKCGEFLGKGYKHYFGPTKFGLSIAYLFSSKR